MTHPHPQSGAQFPVPKEDPSVHQEVQEVSEKGKESSMEELPFLKIHPNLMLAGNESIVIGNLFPKQWLKSWKGRVQAQAASGKHYLFSQKTCLWSLLDLCPPTKRQVFVTMKNQWLSFAETLWTGSATQLLVKSKARCIADWKGNY